MCRLQGLAELPVVGDHHHCEEAERRRALAGAEYTLCRPFNVAVKGYAMDVKGCDMDVKDSYALGR
eukprot:378741-Pyramimonas_sp.AAC.2